MTQTANTSSVSYFVKLAGTLLILQIISVFQYSFSDLCYSFRNSNFLQRSTIIKCFLTYFSGFFTQRNAFEFITSCKCLIIYNSYSFRKNN